ncbi:MAG: leucine--tRNA ligase [Phycisphaerales bacterium]
MAGSLETKWQSWWRDHNTFVQPNPGDSGFDSSKPKFYCLDMFPYPSGAGLHVGHPEGYTATDIVCRYKRAKGFNVLHPMGWDAFGLPAEQYAIQTGVHPAITTKTAIDNFRRQLQRFGFSYDWSREFGTIDPGYYKWTQWIFLKLYNAWFDPKLNKARPISELVRELESGEIAAQVNSAADEAEALNPEPASWSVASPAQRRAIVDSYRLAYQGTTTVNWCPKLGTVLANDEVIDGKSERGGYPVLRKPLKQWMFRITAYADRLLQQLDKLDWPESTKTQQREWIGRSEGAEIDFALQVTTEKGELELGQNLRVFTTRPDTLFGATYMVVAPEHSLVQTALTAPKDVARVNRDKIAAYVAAAKNKSDIERMESKQKTGVDLGIDAINPATGDPVPVWVADYVLMGYGTGAIMAVPGHDERDFEFAKAFNLPVLHVLVPAVGVEVDPEVCFSGDGVAVNSSQPDFSIDGMRTAEAKAKMIDWLEATGQGTRKVNYKFRDWTFSRQRYWGEPFPIVFDDAGNHYAVSDASLPVKLPELADYAPIESDDPQPLLAKAKDWMHTTAEMAGVDPALLPLGASLKMSVTRETNTMPGSAGSSWYALRYADSRNDAAPISSAVDDYWMKGDGKNLGGVDLYLGGSEHAVGHLLYSRFWQNVLFDLGIVATAEPFQKLFHQGLITAHAYQKLDKSLVPSDDVLEWTLESGDAQAVLLLEGAVKFKQPIQSLPRELDWLTKGLQEGRAVYSTNSTIERLTQLNQVVAKMSKSLKNVVNPDDIIVDYGADTFRLYEMAMGPLEASKPWNTKDIVGQYRFLQRIWRNLVDEQTGAVRVSDAAPSAELEKKLHRTIAGVTADIENLALHTAISKLIELNNDLTKVSAEGGTPRRAAEVITLLLAPFAPHMAEELWSKLGHARSTSAEPWPMFDAAMLVDDQVEIPIQVLGKLRGKMLVPAKADAKQIEDLARNDPNVQKHLEGKAIKKVIVVPGRMINFVVG